jgi:hypothetical protein
MKKILFSLLYFLLGVLVATFVSYLNVAVSPSLKSLIACLTYLFFGWVFSRKILLYRVLFFSPILIIVLFFGIIFYDLNVWIKVERVFELAFIGVFFFFVPQAINKKSYRAIIPIITFHLIYVFAILQRIEYRALESESSQLAEVKSMQKRDFLGLLQSSGFLDINGAPIIIPQDYLKNKTVLIDFWYSACSPCLTKMKSLSKLNDRIEYFPNSEILLINDGRIDKFEVFKATASRLPKNLKYLYDVNGKFSKSLEVSNYPYELVLRDNSILRSLVGFNRGQTDELYIADLLKLFRREKL